MNENRKILIIPGNGSPIKSLKINRNAPCKCGSGKKAKNCCGAETRFFHSKSKAEQLVSKLKL
jgi:uncharacterized protein YecA (UPF0149 family)